jgi:hypothetical protein
MELSQDYARWWSLVPSSSAVRHLLNYSMVFRKMDCEDRRWMELAQNHAR